MTTTVENETKDVLNRLDQHLNTIATQLDHLSHQVEKLDHRLERVENDLTTIKVSQAEIKGEMTGINKRLDNAEFINRTIFASIVIAITVGLVKTLGLFPNP